MSTILAFSCFHAPANHPDAVDFLAEVKRVYKPDQVICLGDEIDQHSISFHSTDPDLPGAGRELENAIEQLEPLYKMFPEMDLIDSNHGSMLYRKGIHHGIPKAMLKSQREILCAPEGWIWHKDLVVKASNKQKIYFHHGKSRVPGKLSKNMAMNCVQGHYHGMYGVFYWGSPVDLFWDCFVGCLVDDNHLAMLYNKVTLDRPILGCIVIINGQPVQLPMWLDKHGRWVGYLV